MVAWTPRRPPTRTACPAGATRGGWTGTSTASTGSHRGGRRGRAATLLPAAPDSLLDLGCGDGRLAALALGPARPAPGRRRRQFTGHAGPGPPRLRRRHPGHGAALGPGPLHRTARACSTSSSRGSPSTTWRTSASSACWPRWLGASSPGGLFANLEVVASATPELHAEFLDLIGRPEDDPEDRLAGVGPQLRWMREAGLDQVDCLWRWRGFALLVGRRHHPAAPGCR